MKLIRRKNMAKIEKNKKKFPVLPLEI